MYEVTWRMEHSRCFFSSRMEQADSCIQQPMYLCYDHTITLLPPAEPYFRTLPAEPKPNILTESTEAKRS